MAKLEEQIEKVNKQIEQLKNKKKSLIAKESEEKRKQRTRRLIERGAILESAVGNAEDFTNEQIQALLIEVFSNEFARSAVEKLRGHTERNDNPLF